MRETLRRVVRALGHRKVSTNLDLVQGSGSERETLGSYRILFMSVSSSLKSRGDQLTRPCVGMTDAWYTGVKPRVELLNTNGTVDVVSRYDDLRVAASLPHGCCS
jgi:hypothetical protein